MQPIWWPISLGSETDERVELSFESFKIEGLNNCRSVREHTFAGGETSGGEFGTRDRVDDTIELLLRDDTDMLEDK